MVAVAASLSAHGSLKAEIHTSLAQKITCKSGGKYVEVNDAGFDKEGKYSVKSDTEVEIGYLTYNYTIEGDTLKLYSSLGTATYKKK